MRHSASRLVLLLLVFLSATLIPQTSAARVLSSSGSNAPSRSVERFGHELWAKDGRVRTKVRKVRRFVLHRDKTYTNKPARVVAPKRQTAVAKPSKSTTPATRQFQWTVAETCLLVNALLILAACIAIGMW